MISVVNETKAAPVPPGGWDHMIRLLAGAVERQLQHDFGPPWLAHPIHVTHVPGHAITAHLVDEDKNVPGALAYHDNRGALCDIVVMVKTILDAGGTWTSGSLSVSGALSHEGLELSADAYCATWWTDYNTKRNVAAEVADMVEAEAYSVSVKAGGAVAEPVAVSNFCLPLWGVTDAQGQYDFMGTRHAPFEMAPGGYGIVQAIGQEGQITRKVVGPDYEETDTTRVGGGYRSMRRAGY